MGYQDRDWYKDDRKAKDADAVKRASYAPRTFRRDRSSPPEPHQWPTWAVVLIWLSIFAFAGFIADRFITDRKAMQALERRLMDLKDCDFVASGPCMKIAPQNRR
ncbi:MAG: hypothetical protein RBT42_00345 [Aquabacterium sp.]|jgi:hypothetical protein|uniref:hypothetical protein n=1 Tax=Aquabacterium sp. TaxID=1872578 RepID=UPI002A35BDAD|nr:hypothetical protein [Aquabacterium sp.]MDX9842184.1 hypothetical protein [Aquabacterium sp.]